MTQTHTCYEVSKRLKNRVEIHGDIALIFLNKGEYATINKEDVCKLVGMKWHTHDNKRFTTTYCRGSKWVNGRAVGILLHRLIMDAKPRQIVDHIDHDGLNNCRYNLRICTAQENNRSVIKRKPHSSKYKGVSYVKSCGLWRASITKNKIVKTIGQYKTEWEAAQVYNHYAKKIFGEFAALNKMMEAK